MRAKPLAQPGNQEQGSDVDPLIIGSESLLDSAGTA